MRDRNVRTCRDGAVMATRQIYSDEEFMRWAESLKPCKYCSEKFVGPVCPCERDEHPAPGKRRGGR